MNPVWIPDAARIESAVLTRLMRCSGRQDFDTLRDFALGDLEGYWRDVVADLGLRFRRPFRQVMDLRGGVEWARWFEGGALNFTDTLLAPGGAKDEDIALIEMSESGVRRDITRAQLRREMDGRCRGWPRLAWRKATAWRCCCPTSRRPPSCWPPPRVWERSSCHSIPPSGQRRLRRGSTPLRPEYLSAAMAGSAAARSSARPRPWPA